LGGAYKSGRLKGGLGTAPNAMRCEYEAFDLTIAGIFIVLMLVVTVLFVVFPS
jgi:hypothetical protein